MLRSNSLADSHFIKLAFDFLAKKVFVLEPDDSVKIFAMNLASVGHQLLHEKLLERFDRVDLGSSNLEEGNFKLMSFLIWSLSDAPDRDRWSDIFVKYELMIQLKRRLAFKDVSHLLWAVTLKYKVSQKTFEIAVDSLARFCQAIYDSEAADSLVGLSLTELGVKFEASRSKEEVQSILEDLNSWDLMNVVWGLSIGL